MYPITTAGLAALREDVVQSVNILCTPTKGTAFNITDKDIIGAVTVDWSSVTGSKLDLGSACMSELSFTLENTDGAFDDKVFEGEVECGTLEEVYQMFNLDHPDGYRGRSLSVSDVIEVIGEEKSTFHFCDSIGFREVDFDPDMTEPLKEKKIKVVLCEPGKVARVAEIGTELSDLQRVVGGLIEPYYPFEEQVCIVCNDEGKYNGMRPCRAIYGEDREMMDIIFGPFFICNCSTPYFGSLNKEQLERYKKQFQNPEHFFRVGGEIKAVPYKPEKDHVR